MTDSPGEEHGCDRCRPTGTFGHFDPDDELETIIAEARSSFGEIPVEAGQGVSYRNDSVKRCAACGTHWLNQFWEVDSEETKYMEWGITYRTVTPLSPAEAAKIRTALETHELDHGGFRDRRYYDLTAAHWAEAGSNPAGSSPSP